MRIEQWGDERMRMTRRGFLGASAALAAGLSAAPARAWLMAPMQPAWVTSAPPVPGLGYLTALAIAPSDPSTLLAGGDVHGLKRTTNAGVLWGQIDQGTWKAGRYGISAITPHPTQAGTYYALSGSDFSKGALYVLDHVKGLYAFSPTVAAWTNVSVPVSTAGRAVIPGQPYQGFALDATQPSRLYVATPAGLWRSVNAGSSWARVSLANTEGFGPLVVDPRSGTVFACTALPDESSALTDQPGIYVGIENGTSWTGGYVDGQFAVDFEVLTSDPMAVDTVWAASAGSLFSLGPAS
jgi:hypothetical protein